MGTFTGRLTLACVIGVCAIGAALAGPVGAARTAVRVAAYDYGPAKRQDLTAYWSTAPGARPVIVMVHGGYWIEGSKSGWDGQARRWSARGFTVVAMNYRYATQAHWAAQRADVLKALAWIRAHARGVRADPGRIVVLGASAGGQLAVDAGVHGCGGCRVRGVVALSPVADPYAVWKRGRTAAGKPRKLADATVRLAGCAPRTTGRACGDRWRDLAARTHADAGDAPMLIYHSAHDLVPAAPSKTLAGALRAKGVAVTVRVVPGAKHGGGILGVKGVRAQVDAWIRGRV